MQHSGEILTHLENRHTIRYEGDRYGPDRQIEKKKIPGSKWETLNQQNTLLHL